MSGETHGTAVAQRALRPAPSRATPAGGAHRARRGCVWMAVVVCAVFSGADAQPADDLAILQEVLTEATPEGAVWRFRFVDPTLARAPDYAVLADRMTDLCQRIALPQIPRPLDQISRVVVSIATQASGFGTTDPDLTQYFEAYRIETDRCIWEVF